MKRACNYSLLLLLFSLAVGTIQPCFAQSVQGTVLGLVTDSRGAVIPNATVEVINRDTSFVRKVTTDSTGHYRVPGLEPSTYAVVVTFAGFKKWASDPFSLVVSQIRRVDVTLQVGSTKTTITVSAGAGTAVETETASTSTLHTSQEFTELPLSIYGRSFVNIARNTAALQDANGQFVVNGATDHSNNFTLDGVSTMDMGNTRVSPDNYDIDVDGIQSLKVQTANNSAEYGQVAQFSAYSKAGSNQYHGSLYWGNFNSYFSTRDFFDYTSQKPTFTNSNEFAADVGGPVNIPGLYKGKDKTFFWFSYGGQRYRYGNRGYMSVPTAAFRNGDFSALLHPAAGGKPIQLVDPTPGTLPSAWQPFANNLIPSSRISSVSSTLQKMLYPAPNRPGTGYYGVGNNYTADPGHQFNLDQYSIRIDQKISNRNTMFARLGYTKTNGDTVHGYLLNGLDGNFVGNIPGHNFVLSDTDTISPTLLNEGRFGFNRLVYTNGRGALLGVNYISQLGLQGVGGSGDPAYANNLPAFSFSGTGFRGTSGTNVNHDVQNLLEYTDNMTWIHGKHTFKWGTDIQHFQFNNLNLPSNHVGAFGFNNNISNFDYANFLLGYPSTTTLATPTPANYERSTLFAFYVQDDMRVTPRLTLNYGVRYEYQSPWTEKFDRRFSFNLANGDLVVAGTQMPTDLVPQVAATLPIETSTQAGFPAHSLMYADTNNWNPRIGIAYRPFGGDKTVVRAAYGWYTTMLPGSVGTTGIGGPWTTNTSFNYQSGGPVEQMFPDPFTQSTYHSGVTNISAVDPNYVNMRTQQWNFSIGHQFLGTAIDVAYTGTKNTHLPDTMNFNLLHPSTTPYNQRPLPYPGFNTVNMTSSGGSSIYHGLTVTADHRFRNGLQFNANYAWGKAMTAYSLWGGGGFRQNQYDQQLEYAPDPLVRNQQFWFDIIYQLPIGHGKAFLSNINPVLNQVIGGWQVVTITSMLAGQYLDPVFSGVDPANTGQYGGRPDCVGNANIGNIGASVMAGQPMWNLNAFQVPTGGRGYYGNCARHVLQGPGTNLWNAGLSKNFMLHEGVRLQIQWELFNAWNHPNWGNGNTNVTNGNFGITRWGGGGRSMMFGGRITF